MHTTVPKMPRKVPKKRENGEFLLAEDRGTRLSQKKGIEERGKVELLGL